MSRRADQITIDGGLSAFEKEFAEMERKLREVERILNGTNITPGDLQDIRDKIDQLRSVARAQRCSVCGLVTAAPSPFLRPSGQLFLPREATTCLNSTNFCVLFMIYTYMCVCVHVHTGHRIMLHVQDSCVCACNEGVVLLWLQREPDGERLGARHARRHAAGQRRPRRDGQQPDRRRQGQGRRGQTEGRRVEKQRHRRQGTRPSRSDTASIAAFFRPNELTTLDLLDYAVLLIVSHMN